jgi:hypothetical protein
MLTVSGAAQWVRHDVPQTEGEQITCMLHANGMVYAGTSGGRVIRTSASESRWEDWGQGLRTDDVLGLTPMGTALMAVTDDGLYRRDGSSSVWTWIDRSDSLGPLGTLHVVDDTLVLHAKSRGILRASRDADVWTPIAAAGAIGTVYDVDVHEGVIYAAVVDGVLRSTDMGRTFERILLDTSVTSIDLVYVANDGTIIVSGATKAGPRLNGYSPDAGVSWEVLPVLAERRLRRHNIDDRAGTLVIVHVNESVFRSLDRGRTWEPLDAGFDPRDVDLDVVCIGDALVYAAARPDEVWTRPISHVVVSAEEERLAPSTVMITRGLTETIIDLGPHGHDAWPVAMVYDLQGRIVRTHVLRERRTVLPTTPASFVTIQW